MIDRLVRKHYRVSRLVYTILFVLVFFNLAFVVVRSKTDSWELFGIQLLSGFVSAMAAAWGLVSEARYERKLRELLGTDPYLFPRKERWKVVKQCQSLVDDQLQLFAEAFEAIRQREEVLLTSPPTLENQKELLKFAKELRRLKARFWDTHEVFSRFGFKVKKSYQDYLLASKMAEKTAQ